MPKFGFDSFMLMASIFLSLVSFLFFRNAKKKKRNLGKLRFSQSGLHNVIKEILPSNKELRKNNKTQSKQHNKKTTVRVVYTKDNKAYWVKDNIFYFAEVIDGTFDPEKAQPINTDNLSKEQINNLLFILDALNS